MNPSNPAKFGIAFVLGLVAALAGVTVYVKTTGAHVQVPALSPPAVQSSKQQQPEALNPPKVDETPVTAPKPSAPVAETPVAAPAGPVLEPKPAPTAPTVVAKKPLVVHPRATHFVRAHYPSRSFPESQSTIRVEVSQIRQQTEPASLQPVPVLGEAIRTVDEEQARPIIPPVIAPVISAPQPAAPSQPHTVTLPTGTNVSVRLGETLSTDHNYSGDTFRATLDRPIILDGFIIAEKGSKVLGKIAGLDKSGKFEGTSNLQLALTDINTTDGQRVRIQTGFVNRKGAQSNGGEVAKVGGGAVLGAVIGAIAGGGKGAAIGAGAGGAIGAGAVMAGKGRPAVVPTETQLTFQLAAPTTITEHLN